MRPHRFTEHAGKPVCPNILREAVQESKPRYWVVVVVLEDSDADLPAALKSGAFDFDTGEAAGEFAAKHLKPGVAVFSFWGWRTPLVESVVAGGLLGSQKPSLVRELVDGQPWQPVAQCELDAGTAFDTADPGEDDEDTQDES